MAAGVSVKRSILRAGSCRSADADGGHRSINVSQSASLRRLREEGIALASQPSISRELEEEWRGRTVAALEGADGRDSSQVRAFSRVNFDDATMIGGAERVLRAKAAEGLRSLTIQDVSGSRGP